MFWFVLNMLAQLIPINGGPPITLTKPITVVGRSSRLCDLAVDHGSVSKMHCILVKTDGLIYMRDLGSTNGTRVNGQRVLRGALLPGDQISFSGAVYRIHLGPDPLLSAGGVDLIADPTGMQPVEPQPAAPGRSLADSDLLPAD
ncbi:MAG: FHA domain-containing protein [Planctomycetaceae bacterium]